MKRITLLLFLSMMMPALLASSLEDEVRHCQVIDDDQDRLACFDALPDISDVSEDAVSNPPNPPAAASPQPQTEPRRRPGRVPDYREERFPIHAQVTKISKTIDNRVIFQLDDGSTWMEARTSHRRFKEGVKVTVRLAGPRGAFTSYRMDIDKLSFRVVELD